MTSMLLMMNPGGGSGQGSGSLLPYLGMWGLIIAIFYFLMIRPQRRKQQEAAKMLSELKRGDRVLTTGGLFGSVVGLKDKEGVVVLKIADQVKVEVAKSAVTSVVGRNKED